MREAKFGTIHGVKVRDGLIITPQGPRVVRTGKPCGGRPPDPLASEESLIEALRDLAREFSAMRGDWDLTVKVAHGTILSWDVEQIGCSHKTNN